MKVMTLETYPDPEPARILEARGVKDTNEIFKNFRKKTKSNVNQQLWSHIEIHLGNESYDLGDLPKPQTSPEYSNQKG